MENQLNNGEDELVNNSIPSNNEQYGTESDASADHSEDWDPLQDENDISEDDDDKLEAGDEDSEGALSEDEDTDDLDSDESTGNSGL